MKSIKKEEIKDLSYKDITNIILENNKKGMNTLDLFTMIVDLLELPKNTIDTKIADYYTSLTTDKRFIHLENAEWDLRDRHKVEIIDYDEDDEEETDEEEVDDTLESEDDNNEEENIDEDILDDESLDADDDLEDLSIIDDEEMDE